MFGRSEFASRKWLHADHLGSIIAVTNSNGASPTINTYDEYGIPASTNSGRFQYTGQAWIPELGMYYYKARMYSATLGRFMQTDPIGYKDQINLYAYVGDDPVTLVDFEGGRAATPGEAQLIHSAFGGALDSQLSWPFLIMKEGWLTNKLSGGRSYIDPSGANFSEADYSDDFSKDRNHLFAFYHEFWHRFELRIGTASMMSLATN